jgi:hypothetical protein
MEKVAQRFGILRRALMLAGIMLITVATQATTFIKDIKLIGGTKAETTDLKNKLTDQGWTFIDYDLNKGAGGDYVYLLYKAEDNTDGENWGYITDFYLHEGKEPPSNLTYDIRKYYKAAYNGGEWFVSHYGDLNSNCSGSYIYLYYTKDPFPDNRAVTSITFNATSSGAVRWDGNGSAANLNKGCGSESANIYMHFTTGTAMTRPVTVTIGNGSEWLYTLPFRMNVDYSLSQQIYTAEEIGMAGTITDISFQYASSSSFTMNGVLVYMMHSERDRFTEPDDYQQVNAADKVFEGTFSATDAGWVTITLDTPFEYDGKSNLIITCVDPTEGSCGTFNFCVHKTVNRMGIAPFYEYSPSIDNCKIGTWPDYIYRNNIRFNIYFPGTYSKPDNPTDVPFIPYPAKAEDKLEGSWYTIDGRLLEQAPTAPGLYMHNGETILLK